MTYERILVQIIYFVIVPGVIHLWNENLNLDVILNEACLMHNKKVGVKYGNIDYELIQLNFLKLAKVLFDAKYFARFCDAVDQ